MVGMALWTMLSEPYVMQAVVAAVAVGVVCSLLSVVIVLKRMAFIGQGISHAGFGGVGTAALLGLGGAAYQWEQDLIVLGFCLVTAVVIGAMSRSRRMESDTAIGIMLAGTMAWGVLAQNLRIAWQDWPAYRAWVGAPGYSPPWEAIMFGSLLNVGEGGMWASVAMAAVVVLVCGLVFKELVFYAFDEGVSRVFGVRTQVMHYLLLVMLCGVVVVSIRLVGLILVSALLIMPGATALMLSRRMSGVLVVAVTVGLVGTVGGLGLSLGVGTLSPGASIVAVLFVLFMAGFGANRLGWVR
jgi:ABC-type Mn2+/Zn2+ transport system permease subunit